MKDFCILFIIGFGIGIIYEILNTPQKIKKIFLIQFFSDITFCLVFTIVFLSTINMVNMGEFRLFLLIAYYLGLLIERISLGKLFAKGIKLIYNKTISLWKTFRNSKFGGMIFK
jgi:hypothetical protein